MKCDHIRHLYDVWSRYLKTPYTCNLVLPILVLEREYNTAAVGQMKTRVQAFLEMLAG